MEETDWQLNKDLTACTKYMLENAVYSDVQFRVGEAGEVIKAHKSILAMRSPVFDKMFFGSLPENRSETVISDVEPLVFKALLRYCYYECLDVEPELALSTQYAAKKYMLPILEEACRENQIKNLLPENIWSAYLSSMEWGDEELHEGCHEYLKKNVRDVSAALKSPTFLNIPHKVLLDMLQLNDIKSDEDSVFPEIDEHGILVAEIELFKACDTWAEAECKRQELEVSGPNKRTVLGDCLPLIRFPTMQGFDLVQTVFPSGILTHEEHYRLLEYVQVRHLPDTENNTGFMCSNQHFLIRVKPDTEDTMNRKPSKCESEIHLRPTDNIELERIWIRGEACQCTDLLLNVKYESGKTVIVMLDICTQEEITEEGCTPLLHCPLNNLYLEAGYWYKLKVVHKVRSGGHFHEHDPTSHSCDDTDMTLNEKAKDSDLVNLRIDEVLQDATNECIAALTARLV